jgi:hypothetical protein
MMKNKQAGAPGGDEESGQRMTRRLWLQSAACTAVGVSAAAFPSSAEAVAQAPPLSDVIRAMSALTGSRIEESWVGPTASLVGIILDSAKGLRELDLGETEPATDLFAH